MGPLQKNSLANHKTLKNDHAPFPHSVAHIQLVWCRVAAMRRPSSRCGARFAAAWRPSIHGGAGAPQRGAETQANTSVVRKQKKGKRSRKTKRGGQETTTREKTTKKRKERTHQRDPPT